MNKKINPNLLKLAEQIYNPELKVDASLFKEKATPEEKVIPTSEIDPNLNLADYIILQATKQYPDLIVAKQKSLYNHDWNEAHKELQNKDMQMLTIKQFIDLILLLKSGKVYDGNGYKLSNKEINTISDEILTVRSPWRSEWLDAKFTKEKGILHINYNHRTLIGNKLAHQIEEPLDNCLKKDFYPEKVDLATCNKQGLPTKKGKDINYWYPREGFVARFDAGSIWAGLYCGGNPGNSVASLGVRAARERDLIMSYKFSPPQKHIIKLPEEIKKKTLEDIVSGE